MSACNTNNKRRHDKTSIGACAPTDDSDQTGRKSSGRMSSLIRVFAGRTCIFVGVVVSWIKHILPHAKCSQCVTPFLIKFLLLPHPDCCFESLFLQRNHFPADKKKRKKKKTETISVSMIIPSKISQISSPHTSFNMV